jgi:LmbE family N-acetylglucosaminyl deacetylase
VFDASFTATLPNYKSRYKDPARLVPIYYMMPDSGIHFTPTEYVDITEEFDLKIRMMECHKSQVDWLREHDGIDFSEAARMTARDYGYQCGVPYAEGFCQCRAYLKGTAKRLLP